jgi:hypothetical protein
MHIERRRIHVRDYMKESREKEELGRMKHSEGVEIQLRSEKRNSDAKTISRGRGGNESSARKRITSKRKV